MEAYGGVETCLHAILRYALHRGVQLQATELSPGERHPANHWTEGWVVSKAGLDALENKAYWEPPSVVQPVSIPTELSRLLN
jgi:hypothetical protein